MRVRFLFQADDQGDDRGDDRGNPRGEGAPRGSSDRTVRATGRSAHGRLHRIMLVPLVAGCLLPLAGSATAATPAAAPAARVGTASSTAALAAAGSAHGTGLRPSTIRVPAARGLTAARRIGAVRAATSVPAAVDLTPYAASPGDQGQVGSCVGWATGYTLQGWYANYQRHAGAPFAPMYVYAQINGGRDAGAYIPSAWNILESQGVAEQRVYSQGNYDWSTQPTTAQKTNAAAHKTRSHAYLFSGDNQGPAAQTALQAALAGGQPVVIGLAVHSGFGALSPTNQVWRLANTTGKSLLGYHAIVAVGYDATGLRIENSWGTSWGAGGFATLAWDFVNRYLIEASVGTGFTTTNQPVAPKVTQLSKAALSTSGGETLTITGTELSTVDKTAAGAARLVNVADPTVTAPLTVTAATPTTLTASTTAAPTGSGGVPVQGAYRVVLTGSGGTSSATEAAATVTVLAPYAVRVESGATALTGGGTKITLTGTGFGSSSAAFTANKVTGTVNAQAAVVTWVNDTTVQITVPASGGASVASIVLLHAGVPGPSVSVPYVLPPPAVLGVTPAVASSAGATLTVAVSGLSTGDSTTSVRLVNVASPTVVVTGQITGRSAAALTVVVPALPSDGQGNRVVGSYRVVVTGASGASAPRGDADQVTFVTPYVISVAAGSLASAAGGTALAVTGTDFGTTAALNVRNRITATVNGQVASVTWIGDTLVTVAVPAGAPGAAAAVRLLRNGIASQPDGTTRYAAVITGSTQPSGPSRGGWLSTLSGVGFAGSGGWALVDSAGTVAATLPVVATRDALTAASSGVVLTSGTQATVKLPAAPAGHPGVYGLTFIPSQGAFPGATAGLTSKAYLVYADLG
jgi:Papain family cysteine protease/IPT/TIG domain